MMENKNGRALKEAEDILLTLEYGEETAASLWEQYGERVGALLAAALDDAWRTLAMHESEPWGER